MQSITPSHPSVRDKQLAEAAREKLLAMLIEMASRGGDADTIGARGTSKRFCSNGRKG